ncbi:mannose 6-phosphate receptor domain-containing protein [Paxillus ammoniavirescens]|nr:mannose 6-phosphate receptor domain-containing protein [Paxillus ammoniavirescens]
MFLRRQTAPAHILQLVSFLLLFSSALHAAAQDSGSFDCHFTVGELKYDLSSLGGTNTASRTRDSPPSTYVDEVTFDLCGELPQVEDRASEDQCPSGTRACLTTTNNKGESSARITAVIPVAQSSSPKPETSSLSSSGGVSITFHGGSYPPSSPNPISQSFKISLACAESTSEPQFSSYQDGQVLVEWSTPAACGSTQTPPPKEDESNGGSGGPGKEDDTPIQGVGSGLGFFFLMLLLAFATYFALGAYYNYSTYGARGWDLIPHRDFWREVPYMLQDVIAHLCSNVRTRRSSRGGYIAV